MEQSIEKGANTYFLNLKTQAIRHLGSICQEVTTAVPFAQNGMIARLVLLLSICSRACIN